MSELGKSLQSEIDRYRLTATQAGEDIDRDIEANREDISRLAAIAFKDPHFIEATAAGIADGRISEYEALRIGTWIEQDPGAAGALNAGLFSGRDRADAAVKDVVAGLNRQADLCRVRQNYQELHQKALNALRLPEAYKRQAIVQLQHELELCEGARDARLRGPVSPSEEGGTPQTAATWWEARAATGRNPLGGTDRAWWSTEREREAEEPSTEPDRWTRPR